SDGQPLYLTTGAASQSVVTIALVMLPQKTAEEKAEGTLHYFLTLPISREMYVAAQLTVVGILALPGIILAVALGTWYYGISIEPGAALLVVVPLAVVSLAGVGVAISVLSPWPQVTNALTQITIFYVLLFAPILFPKEQLPGLLQDLSVAMPPTYVADAMRGALTGLPGTNLGRSIAVMSMFALVSVAISAATMRRRG
ncbi:MAG: ABC transporter permease, partial [Chloroflexi bacterium CFX7]|nr:ABC transporter permease [Chloroflexi bacterium CFX7]